MQTPGQIQNSQATRPADRDRSQRGPIVLVGASVRAAAESARIAGFSPIAVDHFGDRETLAAARRWYPLDDFLDSGDSRPLDRIVPERAPIAIVGGLERGFGWIGPTRRSFWAVSPEQFLISDRPEFLRDLASRAAVRFPETRCAGVATRGWLVKRRGSSGGLGVSYSKGAGDIPENSILQRPVRGRICGASFFGLGDRAMLLGACRLLKKRIGPSPFVFAGALGPIPLNVAWVNSLHRLGDAVCCLSPLVGPFNIDVVLQHDTVTLLEVNPRWSASMELVERAWGATLNEPCSMFDDAADWIRRVERVSSGHADARPSDHVFIKRVLFARTDRRVDATDFDRQPSDDRWVWKDVPRRPADVRRHEPLATLIAPLERMSLQHAFRVMV
ncbi:ATP-grasp domain-containing protein [Stieleria sedimenti]|uniref:ATP-grasp domain-containing protein n=1 Tax=Stieleria sedimenti TaxID=2976331 RepID=UPI00217FBAE3|nr:ATP-grasp domain-containing protein [Stieleria sedimenti]